MSSAYQNSKCVNSFRQVDAYICVNKLTIVGLDNGLSPDRRQAIIWTNDGILLIGPLATNFSEISIETDIFLLKKIHPFENVVWKIAPFCLVINVLTLVKNTYD